MAKTNSVSLGHMIDRLNSRGLGLQLTRHEPNANVLIPS